MNGERPWRDVYLKKKDYLDPKGIWRSRYVWAGRGVEPEMTWKFFHRDEFACKCGCKQNHIEDSFVDKLDFFREYLGFPLPVSSGYRCPSHNAKVSTTGLTGPHTTGHAADLLVSRGNAFKLISAAEAYGFTGIGVKQHGDSRFIHLDDLTAKEALRPTIWSY